MPFCSTITKRNARKCLAGLLCVWLSGVAFLVCCGKIQAATSGVDSCPLARMHGGHCDKARSQAHTAPNVLALQGGDCVVDCGILQALFDRSRKTEPVAKLVAVASNAVTPEFRSVAIVKKREAEPIPLPRIESRQDTYLRNCNFRI